MSDLLTLIEEGRRLLDEARPEIKVVMVTHNPPEADGPGTHKSHVVYTSGGNTHHYVVNTKEHPKKAGTHTIHKVTPEGEPTKDAEGKDEPPIHKAPVAKKDFETHGGPQLHQYLVRSFTDRLHPAEPKRRGFYSPETSKEEMPKEPPKKKGIYPPKSAAQPA